MKYIKTLSAFLLFGILLPVSISHAQNSEKSDPDPLQKGSTALQFQISDNFNLDSFSGSIISYKRQHSDTRANRIGLSLNNSYSWRNFPDNDNDLEITDLDLSVGIDYTWMTYTNPDSDIKFYYGYGPGINFGIDKASREETDRKNTRQTAYYGVAGIGYAGVEWFFQSSMSLHAEYRGSVRINHRRETNTSEVNGDEDVIEANTTSIRLGGNGVRFGLSVYF